MIPLKRFPILKITFVTIVFFTVLFCGIFIGTYFVGARTNKQAWLVVDPTRKIDVYETNDGNYICTFERDAYYLAKPTGGYGLTAYVYIASGPFRKWFNWLFIAPLSDSGFLLFPPGIVPFEDWKPDLKTTNDSFEFTARNGYRLRIGR